MIERVRPIPKPKGPPTILDAINSRHLFAKFFKNPESWAAWRTFLATLFGLPLDNQQLELFRQCTQRDQPKPDGYREANLVIGRRGGKSFVLALIAVYLASFRDWRQYLNAGERATIMVIAADRRQARVITRYCKGLLRDTPVLRELIENERAESIDLTNRVTIEVHTASFRTTRGYSIVAALCDELAFWSSEDSAEPDVEVLAALRPGMASIPDATLLCASSPYSRKGALWNAYRKHFGKASPVLVWQAATRTMNPSIPQSVIDDAMEADPSAAAAEYLAEFRSDLEAFVSREAVEACVSRGVFERPYRSAFKYFAFTDPSGGANDSFTLAIGHKDADSLILDCLREIKPPFSPENVILEFSGLLKSYRVSKVIGDRYAGEFPRELFRKNGIGYETAHKPKSDLYIDLLALLNSRKIELLDHVRLVNQLVSLERRISRSGHQSIDHPPSSHDDLANVCAGVFASNLVTTRGIVVGTASGDGFGQITWGPKQQELDRNGCHAGPGLDAALSLHAQKQNYWRPT